MWVVDARGLELPLTGIGRYVAGLLDALPGGVPEHMVGVARPGVPVDESRLPIERLRPNAWNAVWNEVRLASYLGDARSYWATKWQVPRRTPRSCTVVSTVHDLFHRTHPEDFSVQQRLDLGNAMRATVRRADVITVTCRHVSDELRRFYGRSADVVVAPAPTVPQPQPTEVADLRERLPASFERWVLYVGNLVPRKNVVRLADAVATLPGVGLLVVGSPVDPDVVGELDRRPWVHRRGYADQHELSAYYGVADVLALVSHVEGFGLPLLDARALGLPAVVSDRAPLPENAGRAAHVVDPTSVEAIAAGLRGALEAGPADPEALPSWEQGATILAGVLGLPAAADG